VHVERGHVGTDVEAGHAAVSNGRALETPDDGGGQDEHLEVGGAAEVIDEDGQFVTRSERGRSGFLLRPVRAAPISRPRRQPVRSNGVQHPLHQPIAPVGIGTIHTKQNQG